MSLLLKRDVHRWSLWYPASWRAENGAAMLGTYLDMADAEGRRRLSVSDKAALVTGGLSARLDVMVPGAIRDHVAAVMIGLLGAYGLVSGLLFEWAPWAAAERATRLEGMRSALMPTGGVSFGPFMSPFVILSILAFVAWLASLIGPAGFYRMMLVVTMLAGLVLAADAHFQFFGFSIFLRSMPCLFAVIIAGLALIGARPRPLLSVVGAASWTVALIGFSATLGAWVPGHTFNGMMEVAGLLVSGPEPFAILVGVQLTLLAALALTFMKRRAIAAVLVLVTLPWAALVALRTFGLGIWVGTFGNYLLLTTALIVGYVTAVVIAIVTHRNRSAPTTNASGFAGTDAPDDLGNA